MNIIKYAAQPLRKGDKVWFKKSDYDDTWGKGRIVNAEDPLLVREQGDWPNLTYELRPQCVVPR